MSVGGVVEAGGPMNDGAGRAVMEEVVVGDVIRRGLCGGGAGALGGTAGGPRAGGGKTGAARGRAGALGRDGAERVAVVRCTGAGAAGSGAGRQVGAARAVAVAAGTIAAARRARALVVASVVTFVVTAVVAATRARVLSGRPRPRVSLGAGGLMAARGAGVAAAVTGGAARSVSGVVGVVALARAAVVGGGCSGGGCRGWAWHAAAVAMTTVAVGVVAGGVVTGGGGGSGRRCRGGGGRCGRCRAGRAAHRGAVTVGVVEVVGGALSGTLRVEAATTARGGGVVGAFTVEDISDVGGLRGRARGDWCDRGGSVRGGSDRAELKDEVFHKLHILAEAGDFLVCGGNLVDGRLDQVTLQTHRRRGRGLEFSRGRVRGGRRCMLHRAKRGGGGVSTARFARSGGVARVNGRRGGRLGGRSDGRVGVGVGSGCGRRSVGPGGRVDCGNGLRQRVRGNREEEKEAGGGGEAQRGQGSSSRQEGRSEAGGRGGWEAVGRGSRGEGKESIRGEAGDRGVRRGAGRGGQSCSAGKQGGRRDQSARQANGGGRGGPIQGVGGAGGQVAGDGAAALAADAIGAGGGRLPPSAPSRHGH